MKPGRIEKPSLGYRLFLFFGYTYYRLYFRRFKVVGKRDFPAGKPVIFAANHQDALMDAIALLYSTLKQLAFLSRADIFKKKIIARILHWLKMMPVYRPRDGVENMGQNEETFQNAAHILLNNRYLALFPEGNHAPFKRLRPLKKGIFRIAFLAEEKSDFSLGLQIIPVGLDYSNYYNAGSELLVNFGEPILVSDFKEAYRENPVKGINALRRELETRMKAVMIHIEPVEYYQPIFESARMYYKDILTKRGQKASLYNRYTAQKEIVARAEDAVAGDEAKMKELKSRMDNYTATLSSFGLRDWVVEKNCTSPVTLFSGILLMIILLPLHIYGVILNYIAYKTPVYFSRKAKDRVFHSSYNFGISLLLYPIYYLFLMVLVSFLVKGFFIKFIFLLSLPLSGLLAFYYYKHFLKLRGKLRLARIRFADNPLYRSIINERAGIINLIKAITNL